jgi:hypothetical protein
LRKRKRMIRRRRRRRREKLKGRHVGIANGL